MARIRLVLFLLSLFALALAEPVQYCRFGHRDGAVDFCMGLTTAQNTSTSAHDMYLHLTVSRSSALGWTALGTGPTMASALMFIVYGDPSMASSTNPTLSIRTADGHHQPQPLNASTPTGGAALHILHAKWQPVASAPTRRHDDDDDPPAPAPGAPATHVADILVACYACGRWPGSPLSPTSSSQPWIWAWNDHQRLSSYAPDAHLTMHAHHASSGGYGTFYVDMARSLSTDPAQTIPTLQAGVAKLGTSDRPIGAWGLLASLKEKPLVKAHALFMSAAFMVLFPLGVVLMRVPAAGKGASPFRRHWVVQVVALALTWAGVAVGVAMTHGRMPRTVHQWVGLGIAVALGLQAVLGWRHHMVFLRIRRRTWVSVAHVWLGRSALVFGWANVVTGMVLSGHGRLDLGVVGVVAVVEAVSVAGCVWWVQRKRRAVEGGEGEVEAHALMPRDEGGRDYFALEMSDDEVDLDSDADEVDDGKLGRELGNGGFAPKASVDGDVVKK
ncbi:hypothetical protein B0T22DRAFT_474268 [Podospora appendiculata]|uniref:Cytochrome b561 domain-containing protein n=1 Tax=Podospora appendiculata TaxID=314037 RepID=A0AAE0WYF0_9PEZI|nr:hypothetical protein B0T22DRAFT_474268 [Podospora appendiculata]